MPRPKPLSVTGLVPEEAAHSRLSAYATFTDGRRYYVGQPPFDAEAGIPRPPLRFWTTDGRWMCFRSAKRETAVYDYLEARSGE